MKLTPTTPDLSTQHQSLPSNKPTKKNHLSISDLMLQSKSGTGKTLIFTTILLERLMENPSKEPHPESLIIAPTREIAVQIEDILRKVGCYIPSFKVVSVIGGLDVTDDRKKIQGSKCIVGTPGRILHLIQNKVINLSNISLLILDEADRLLSFKEIDEIRSHLPTKKQTIACSATFTNDLDKKLTKIMKNPLFISSARRATVLLGIKQFIYRIPEESSKTSILEMTAKVEALKNIFNKISFKQCIIFTNSQSRAESYKTYLDKEGWASEVITGAMDQPARLDIFKKFRAFQTKILVTTDLMSRGVDSEHLNLVINLDLPDNEATYLHRIGRAGRFGSQGISITFISSKKDEDKLKRLLNTISNGMRVLTFPQDKEESSLNFWELKDEEEQSLEYSLAEVQDVTLEPLLPAHEDDNVNVNTQTYNIIAPSDSISEHLLEFTMDRNDNLSPSLLQQLHPISSNTIDDASSIAVDSEILKSQIDTQNVLDLLIDPPKELGRRKKVVDIFEDYKNIVDNGNETESTSEEDTCEPTDSNSLIISNVKKLLIDNSKKPIKKDIFSEYENLHDSMSTSQNVVPDNNDSSDADGESSTSQDEYEVNNEEVGEEEQAHSTVSSGFDERTTSGGSSGIETSDVEDAGLGQEEHLSEESTDDDSSDDEESSSDEEEVHQHNHFYSHSSSRSYDPAFEMWQNLYWNQFNMIQNYVRFSSQI